MGDIVSVISSVGFPIVACVGLSFYVKYQTDAYRQEVKDLQKEHRDEINKMTEALNNNTEALNKLIDKLEDKL